jgi:hypothetical protein
MDTKLFVEPTPKRFPTSKEADFRSALAQSASSSVFAPIQDARDVLLSPDGSNRDGYRFTSQALFQLCHTVCPGLYRLILELSGVHRGDGEPSGDFSQTEAIQTLNKIVTRRCVTRLSGKQLLRDTKSKLIEGLVGSTYQRLTNLELYQRTREAIPEADFYEACLVGRSAMFRLYKPKDAFAGVSGYISSPDVFYRGFHFSNNEVGKGAVKAAPFIMRAGGRTCAMAKSVTGSSLRHQGDTFAIKLAKLIESTSREENVPAYYRERISWLRRENLGLGLQDNDAEEARRQDLVHFLTRNRMRTTLAVRVVASMLGQGSYDEEKTPLTQVTRETLRERDEYDLFNAIGREAKRTTIAVREQAEQVAYALLTGKIRVPKPARGE